MEHRRTPVEPHQPVELVETQPAVGHSTGAGHSTGGVGRGVAVVAGTGAVAAYFASRLWYASETCDDGFACLGTALFALAYSALVTPLLVWLALRVLRVPRAFLLAAVGVVLGHLFADLGAQVVLVWSGFDYGYALPPSWATLLMGAAAGVAAWATVGRGPRPIVRGAVLVTVVAVSFATYARVEQLAAEHRVAELAEVPVTPYLPDLGARTTPLSASVRDGALYISYRYDPLAGEGADYPGVYLVPSPETGPGTDACAAAESVGYGSGSADSGCTRTAAGFVGNDGIRHYVGVTRGDTTLVAVLDPDTLADSRVADALAAAPRVSAEALVEP